MRLATKAMLSVSDRPVDAVITIQGGGIFGISMLGQLASVMSHRHLVTPIAFAGTSAGAIIATLVWGGLAPGNIRKKLTGLVDGAQGNDTLLSVLGAASDSNETVARRFDRVADVMAAFGFGPSASQWSELPGSFTFAKTALAASAAYAFHRRRLNDRWQQFGLFAGERLELLINQWLCEADDVKALREKDKSFVPAGSLITFGDYKRLGKRPPLFLTTTDLARSQLTIISSIDKAFHNVPVAKAARASAGFPIFFTPTALPGAPSSGAVYVDGGIVSNFPAWIFPRMLRQLMETDPDYQAIAAKAWMHIGLRVQDDPAPPIDVGANPRLAIQQLSGMLTGKARDQLESLLSDNLRRSVVIGQRRSQTGGPQSVLDFAAVTKQVLDTMYEKGRGYSDRQLKQRIPRGPITWNADTEKDVRREIEQIRERATMIWKLPSKNWRVSLFVAVEEHLIPLLQVGFESEHREAGMAFGLEEGLVGRVFTRRRSCICNLKKATEIGVDCEDSVLNFGMDASDHALITRSQTWLAGVPVVDPFDSVWDRDPINKPRYQGQHCREYRPGLVGGCLGVISLDGCLDYTQQKLPDEVENTKHYRDERVCATLDVLTGAAQRLAPILVPRPAPNDETEES